jgi:hypothetical protein
MGRPKKFNRKGVLEKALPVFWRHGFADASLHELEQATGVNKSGLYSEFEDKEDLLALSTIDRGRAGELPSIRVDQPVVQTVGAELVHTPLKIIKCGGEVELAELLDYDPACKRMHLAIDKMDDDAIRLVQR